MGCTELPAPRTPGVHSEPSDNSGALSRVCSLSGSFPCLLTPTHRGTAPRPLIFLAYRPLPFLFSPKMSQGACCTTWLKLATHFSFWKPSSTPATPQTLTFDLVLLLFNYTVNCLITYYLGLQLDGYLQLTAPGLAYIRHLPMFESLSGEFAITPPQSRPKGWISSSPLPPDQRGMSTALLSCLE